MDNTASLKNTRLIGTYLFIWLVSLVVSTSAFAGYEVDKLSTTAGDSSFEGQELLKLSSSISGSNVTFTVSKITGTFSNTGTIHLKVGSYIEDAQDRDLKNIYKDESSVSFTHNLDDYSSYPKEFYGRYQNEQGGWAWVGPIEISQTNNPPTTPSIGSSPSSATLNEEVSISVTRGTDPDGDNVKVQCWADNSNRTNDTPFVSSYATGGSSVQATFTFNQTGTQTIYCNSFDPDGLGGVSASRSIDVITAPELNNPPTTPSIGSSPSSATLNEEVSISVTRGADPDGDNVKVQCWADNSNRTNDTPFVSSYATGGSSVQATFTFNQTGTQTIYCNSFDPDGLGGVSASRSIDVISAGHPTQVLSPIKGQFKIVNNVNDCPSDKWCFNQHGTDLHSPGGGIGASDDTYAWDINLNYPKWDSDKGQAVYSSEEGVVTKTYGGNINAGGSYGQVLIEHNYKFLEIKNVKKIRVFL